MDTVEAISHSEQQARAQVDSIVEMVRAMDRETDEDSARERIQEDALSVEVRSGWTTCGEELKAEEFMILLCTGGPACRLRGELNGHNEPCRVFVEHQDWGTPWTEYYPGRKALDACLRYAQQFFFGE